MVALMFEDNAGFGDIAVGDDDNDNYDNGDVDADGVRGDDGDKTYHHFCDKGVVNKANRNGHANGKSVVPKQSSVQHFSILKFSGYEKSPEGNIVK
ncbi:hypothetical protein PoB_006288300 [Plakobranchus ocellatus]|uniref:Uncharacterized protein n=1 Tax=Plakobranchus ocellatus TaxID=259542 RepID=A0AAV4CWV8_9GAST|nr:hypothetical protein PoB_006288300 [Plakobranchus ocellatus]